MRKLISILALAVAASAMMSRAAAPESYLEYVATDGSAYIDTGVIGKAGTKVEAGMMWGSISGDIAFVGARNNTDGRYLSIHVYSSQWWFGYKNQKGGKGTPAANTYYTVTSEVTSAGVYTLNVNGDTFSEDYSSSVGNYSSELPLYLFALSRESNGVNNKAPAGTRCYYLKIWQDGVLVRDYKPCYHDGIVTLYDVQNDTYATPSSGVLVTKNMTITPSDPQWGSAITVCDGDALTIDAGEGATWQGAITVLAGGSLTTRGALNVGGTVTVNANGAIDVAEGTSLFAFGSKTMSGTLIVRAGAEFKANRSDSFNYSGTFNVHVYGTFNCQTFRQSINADSRLYLHDGAKVVGVGDGSAGIDFYQDNTRMVVDGNVVCEAPFRTRTAGHNLKLACCENANVKFLAGFTASAGNIVQEAATVAEGNASGTCANAKVEIGSNTGSFTGSLTLVSDATLHLKGASIYPVTTSAPSLELRADSSMATANHSVLQVLPVITTTTATVRLTGEGTVQFPETAPAYPVEFAGASLVIATNAPLALAAGSSVTAPTTVGVEGLAAYTAATLFTGAGASFDVSKVSARPAHNGVLMGTPAAVVSDGASAIVTTGVPAYDALGWVEPYVAANALIWLDASDAANFVFKDNTFGLVTTWKDKSAYKRDATAYTVASHDPNWGTLTVTNGVPAYCMGDVNSGIDLQYTSMSHIQTGFFVMSIRQSLKAFFLGRTDYYNFHRGNNGAYSYGSGGNQLNVWFEDGVQVENTQSTLVPTDRHVYSFYYTGTGDLVSNRLTCDRTSDASSRHGGRELSELILFNTVLPDADRQAIESYLAAKWMGANPTASGTVGTYAVKGELEVDDAISGTQNLTFAEGASVSVSNPSSSTPMLSTTGSVTISPGAPLAVSVDASALVPGTYTVMQAASGITSLSQFAPTATVGDGAAATFAVVDGKLTMTIAISSSVAAQTWRPANASDLGWNATSANWLYDGGTTGGFIPYVPAFIDGLEAATGDIMVTGTQTAGPITLTGASDYTFKGDGTLAGGDTVTLGGTGTVTLDGVSFGDQTIAITNGQKVVLGFNASQNALGTDSGSTGGKVEIGGGGQLNINYTGVVSGTADPRAEITHHKTFAIAGDGPDGRGALINDALDGRGDLNPYGSQFRRIELTDDATVGGTHRMEVRAHTATAGTATPGIYGPGKRLTVKSTNPYGFGVVSQPVKVEAVTIVEGARLRPEAIAESQFDIPGGITLDGGTMDLYSSTFSTNVPFYITANGGKFIAGSGATTIKGNVNVASGASLALTGDKNVTFSGAFNANGATVTHSSSATTYFRGASPSGNLAITQTAGNCYLDSGFSNGTVNVTQSGGNSGLYITGNDAPVFSKLNFSITGGDMHFRPQVSKVYEVGDISIDSPDSIGNIYVYGPAGTVGDYGIAAKMTGKMYHLAVGGADGSATLRIKSGSDFSVQAIQTGAQGSSKALRGRLIVENGAKVTIRGSNNGLRNGRRGTAPDVASTHVIEIAGEVDSSARDVYVLDSAPRGEMYLNEGGVLKALGLQCTPSAVMYYTNGVTAAEGRCWFIMDGGRLELGANGIAGARVPGVTKIDIRSGTVKSAAAWSTNQMLPLFFGYEALGGAVELDLGSYNLTWNTGLSGASDVTLKGSANFVGKHDGACVRGVMLGKLTVQNTGANDLKNASAFSGGLSLAPGVNAEVAACSGELYAAAMGGGTFDPFVVSTWSYPFVGTNIWGFAHARYATANKPYPNAQSVVMRGEFYVPEEKAGTWTFAGSYDDKIRLDIDGVTLFSTTSSTGVGRGTATLAVGWHKFIVTVYDNTGNAGPNSGAWTNGKALGFIVGESTSTAGGDYTKFEPGASLGDGLTLQVRPGVNACVWSYCATKPVSSAGASNWETLAAKDSSWSHVKCLDSAAYMHLTGSNAAADKLGFFSGKLNRFQGWFKVEDGKDGDWTFTMTYDDFHKLTIDGEVVVTRTSSSTEILTATRTLTAGWHRWEVLVGDASSGWGPNARNSGMTLSYKAPGDTADKRFDEVNLKLAATLGDIAVLEPTGIYKDLELGAGSTLTSSGTMAMPICGTLKGTGTLAGSWEFAGTTNCWEVADASATSADLPAATFAAATPATFAGLKSVKVTFDAKPTRHTYFLTGAINGLTATDIPAAAITVKDAEDGDYSANFTLTVKNGRLALSNSKAAGMTVILR